jgi:hypothetical protein
MDSRPVVGTSRIPKIRSAVFVGELEYATSSGVQRSWALETSGVQVTNIDATNYRSPNGRLRSACARLTKKFHLLYDQERLEANILAACAATSPEIIWFEWPRSFRPDFLQLLKSTYPASTLISFQDDNPFGARHSDAWQWRNYLRCIPLFDLHLVKRQTDLESMRDHGARHTRLWIHGVYPPLFHPPTNRRPKIYPVSFVGTCFDDRAEFFDFLIGHCKLPVHIFGSHWQRRSELPRAFPTLFHSEVHGAAYVDVIQQSIICLGMVSKSNHDEWSLRTYEIPGCAGMFLAQRTPTHETLYTEGKEALFFSNANECADAIRHLLLEPERADRIGSAAYARCVADNRFLNVQMSALLMELANKEHIGVSYNAKR